ncbi:MULTISPECIES: enoyl-CoA hydratase/isomerase family protein [unclassified Ruegeria]|uniref:enoyl-CoA hydratase/isomerase family protein n=1 Tax=unclassified Ruegeria TaxID=2625375 RepID=UPI001ADD5FB2|nr:MULTISPECIES: enoyl-CoA hydratase/isomerase family protein [unclassified Ruegeria]MBO9413519.1 enoyl-CoA hydratase/isomerase family protein [Ruegeria sp. R8_1]MBO9417298.1 enoyl-CoA hydratase/isomerase family protein [Ruegeria sp. R8_2]
MEHFLLDIQDGIARLTLNRPERLNAVDEAMMDALMALCRQIEHTQDAHVVILTGAGKAFCAGGDIDAWSSQSADTFGRHWLRDGHQALDALTRLRQPVIAVLNGHVLGGGLELAACADYRIAEDHIRIGQPEPALGIIPGWSGTQRAVRRFGAQLVRRMALFGEQFSAHDALTAGIVDQVVEKGQGLAAADELANRMRHRGPVATELVKMLINAAEGEERERVFEALAGRIAAVQPELKTGLAAFKDRKKPDFW